MGNKQLRIDLSCQWNEVNSGKLQIVFRQKPNKMPALKTKIEMSPCLLQAMQGCRIAVATAVVLLTMACAGCNPFRNPLPNTYGKVRKDPGSINGISLFAKRLEQRGYEVKVRNRISPRMNDFDTVIWFPDTDECPSDRATEAIESWLTDGYSQRTFIYVGGHYHADLDYLRAIESAVPIDQKEELLRRQNEQRLKQQKNSQQNFVYDVQRTTCNWFDHEIVPTTTSNQLAGPWVDDMLANEMPEIEYHTLFKSKTVSIDWSDWQQQELLTVDEEPFVTQFQSEEYGRDQLILVNHASFLVNFGIVSPQRSALADRLIDQISLRQDEDGFGGYQNSRVLILESGPSAIPVRDSDFVNKNSWAWIAEKPMRYIVPHALFWGVLFCFVYFPIFGRPKKLERKSTSTFRNHIDAVAKQFARTGNHDHARNVVKHYQETVSDTGSK